MKRLFSLLLVMVALSGLVTTARAATPTPTPELPGAVCALEGLTFHEPTVDEMVAPGSTVLAGYDDLKADLLAGLREVYPDAAGVELVEPSGAATPCWMVLARDGLRRVLWAVGEDGEWMEWPVYYVRDADGKFSLATEVGGQTITYKPVPGSENAHGTFEGDRESGKVLPILARQAVPTTDKGAVYSQFADMMKEEIEWKTVEDIGEVTTLPEGVKDLQTAIDTGWEWGDEKWEQHIVWTENREIQFDTITMNLSKSKELQIGSTYITPLGSRGRVGMKTKQGYSMNLFEFLTSEVGMDKYINSSSTHDGYYVEIETDYGKYMTGSLDKYFTAQGFMTDSTDKGKLAGGYFTLVVGLPDGENVKQIKLARKPDASLWVIYDEKEMNK